ncbi:MAG TPA: STAS domain-containing protein [Acidimicrobiales bacterium]|jgi:anti-sigma B factor antagonist
MAPSGPSPFAVVVSLDDLDPGAVLVTASGEIDVATAPRVQAAILAQLDGRPVDVVVDLSAVSFLDSSGISALIRARRRVGEVGGTLRLRNPQPKVRRVLQITGVEQAFVIETG